MGEYSDIFVGLDVAKDRHAVAIAEGGRDGDLRYFGEIGSDTASVRALVRKLAAPGRRLRFCYEAGPTGYGLKREIEALGHECVVIAPSLIPRRAGDRIKTNRRDAEMLARLYRAGELTAIWTPDVAHEAMRDLTRHDGRGHQVPLPGEDHVVVRSAEPGQMPRKALCAEVLGSHDGFHCRCRREEGF